MFLLLQIYLYIDCQQGSGYNFDFKLSYKFLRRSEAHLRYGNSSMSTWRGELVNGTYCDRVLTKCDTRACRLQSPNYPGVYPRNVTCYYRVEQNRAPPGHRALLAVSQRNSHKIHIKDQVVKYDGSQRILRYRVIVRYFFLSFEYFNTLIVALTVAVPLFKLENNKFFRITKKIYISWSKKLSTT